MVLLHNMKFKLPRFKYIGAGLLTVGAVASLIAAWANALLPIEYVILIFIVVGALSLACYFTIQRHNKLGIVLALIVLLLDSSVVYFGISSRNAINAISFGTSSEQVHIDNSESTFNVYISGIDTYGDISTISRSDVNIIVTINQSKHTVLLTSIPRDSYVAIAGGGNNQGDKLTHSGIYGVDASMKTVANLMDVPIDKYVRLNFTSLVKIVDILGGVDVENPITFKTDEGEVFNQGKVHLNGTQALAFSRERHDLAGGDNDRGKNQERVLTAIVAKLSSTGALLHYQSILNSIGNSVQTNIDSNSTSSLVRNQIDSNARWTVVSRAVSGHAQYGLHSYAMPQANLYFTVLDKSSIDSARQAILSQ